ncbi:hypothetical protein [Hydrogenophaga sp. BPS33]|uniref:hypothetical protein n=1 Tax=Hydrogenophaga sp. BPS33 TaxID=2651974 RepID=UPI00131F9797|nr:hypothetical protein [Hydrogenophaga sp. BPS33]QHE86321.1 hypothetical protein F9K07_16120 [Hydrogenophaga sp. BPS33]
MANPKSTRPTAAEAVTHSPLFTEEKAREGARLCARLGVANLARAINHTDDGDIEWKYSDEVQQRFFELAAEMVALVERGEVFENPQHAQWRRARAAKHDHAVQQLIRKASQKTRIR